MKLKKIYYALPIFILAIVMVGFVAVQPSNSLTMDVNPSIEIVTNRLDRVVEINPLNDDAEELLKDFDPKNKNLESTINDLVDLLILSGHIKGGEDNFVMITVDDDSMDSKLVEKVNKAIAAMLENKKIEATVLNQAISKSEKEDKITGVQLAAQRLNEIDNSLTAEEIDEMNVRELVHYSKEKGIPIASLFRVAEGNSDVISGSTPKISNEAEIEKDDDDDDKEEYMDDENKTQNIISKEKVSAIALAKVSGEIIKIELDSDDDDPEYEILISKDGVTYKFEIDAINGKVKEFEREDDDDDDDDDKKEESNETSKNRISADQAKVIALDFKNGGVITEFESDDDEFEVKVMVDGKEYEIKIHAFTGEILDFEVENNDDYYENKDEDDHDEDEDDNEEDDHDDDERDDD